MFSSDSSPWRPLTPPEIEIADCTDGWAAAAQQQQVGGAGGEEHHEERAFHPLAQMFSQRLLLAEFDMSPMGPPTDSMPPPVNPQPEPELRHAAGRVSPVPLDDDFFAAATSPHSWAAVATPAPAEELALSTALVAIGESTQAAVTMRHDLPFNLLGENTDLLGGRLLPTATAAAAAHQLVSLETTEGFLQLADSPPSTPEHGDQHDGWSNPTHVRSGRASGGGMSSGSAPSHTAADYNRYNVLTSLNGEHLPAQQQSRAKSPGRHVPRYTTVSPDRGGSSSRRHSRGSTGSVSSIKDDLDLPPAHFVSSTETMSQIFTLPYMDSEVSIVLHRVGGMLVMEGTLNGSDLGSGSVSAAGDVGMMAGGGGGARRSRRKSSGGAKLEPDLASNFLFFSSSDSGEATGAGGGGGRALHSTGAHTATPAAGAATGGGGAEPPAAESSAAAAQFRHKFMWEFEDYGLMLGSDIIVFSNDKHPKFSMQLHDVNQEVSSLACLELWMNNVFQSIPETGICCHKDGFVQGYKLMKTNELPTLSGGTGGGVGDAPGGSGFQPAAVMEHGASILKFLHTNCEKEGATYWLHRSGSDGSLQLFEVPLGAQEEEAEDGAEQHQHPEAAAAPSQPERQSEQQQQRSVSVATLCFRMAERFADEGGEQYGSATGGVGERRLRLYRRCVELIDSGSAPQLWAAATEKIAEFSLSPLGTLNALTLHATRRITSEDSLISKASSSGGLTVASAVEALGLLCAARDATAALLSTGADEKDQQVAGQNHEMLHRLTLRLVHICLWLGHQCLTVGCANQPPSPPLSPRKANKPQVSSETTSLEPDIGAGLHQLALASWLLEQHDVPAEPGGGDAEGRIHVVALLTLTGKAFADLARAGVRGGQLNAVAGPAVVKLAAAQAAAGLRGDDTSRFSVAAVLGLNAEEVAVATSSGGWLGTHVHAAAVVPGMDAEQNFNQAVQFLLRALRLAARSAPTVTTTPAPTVTASPARPAASVVAHETRGGGQRLDVDREDGGKKRTAPFTGGAGSTAPASSKAGTKELVVVPGQGRNDGDDSEAVGSTISTALGAVYHALGDHYTATGRRTKAHRHCQQGITLFNSISDRPNAALCMAAIGRIVRSGAIETDSERSFSSAAVDVYTLALSWCRQAREMLRPLSSYPRTWRKLRPELAATAAASAALLQSRLPQLADQQRVEAELEILSALGDAISAYREILAETDSSAAEAAMAWLNGDEQPVLGTAEGAKLAGKIGDLEHQLGLFHGWRAITSTPGAAAAEEDSALARGRKLRKVALSQAQKHLSEAVRWLLLSAATVIVSSLEPVAPPESPAYPQADVASLRKQMVGQLEGGLQAQGGSDSDNRAEAAAFTRVVQLSVRASVEVSRAAMPPIATPGQLPTGLAVCLSAGNGGAGRERQASEERGERGR